MQAAAQKETLVVLNKTNNWSSFSKLAHAWIEAIKPPPVAQVTVINSSYRESLAPSDQARLDDDIEEIMNVAVQIDPDVFNHGESNGS